MKWLLVPLLWLAGCSEPSDNVKVIAGAGIPSQGIEFSMIVVEGKTLRAVGRQSDIPVPKGAQMTSGLGKLIEPASGATLAAGQPATFALVNGQSREVEARMVDGVWQ